ncbi:uncharacterized protein [Aristolochia californica]|uniref:uncharacterized protein n=1 Tax=Aristolochia californica TaxID=171875 RepID=UPI0035D7DB81
MRDGNFLGSLGIIQKFLWVMNYLTIDENIINFWVETEQSILDAVLRGHIDFASNPWPSISSGASLSSGISTRPIIFLQYFGKIGRMDEAVQLFDDMPERKVENWISLLRSSAEQGNVINYITVVENRNSVLTACAILGFLRLR